MVMKRGVMENKRGEEEELELGFFGLERIIRRVGGTCSRKPQILFYITHILSVGLGFF
jgi:hypothetical protein